MAFGLIVAGLLAWIFLRKLRSAREAEPIDFAVPVTPEAPELRRSPPLPAASPKPAPPAPAPLRNVAEPSLLLDLAAARMSASLVNATLAYRLLLTAGADISDVSVRGGMTSAHASRPAEDQLTASDAPQLHSVGHIAAGDIVELTGEIRLPLADITPIRHGSAALFVPLVRLEVTGLADGRPLIQRAAFVVGIDENAGGERLQPFRLDLGPRIYSQVSQRALTVPVFA